MMETVLSLTYMYKDNVPCLRLGCDTFSFMIAECIKITVNQCKLLWK